ncbi:MAG: hypothetical protein ACYC8T_03410 [Myxococcaceae bacterium]
MEFARTYASLRDEELMGIHADRLNLVPEAVAALDKEVHLRGIDVSGVVLNPRLVPEPPATAHEAAASLKLGMWLGIMAIILVMVMALGRR